jgi:molecular chaperone GrpE
MLEDKSEVKSNKKIDIKDNSSDKLNGNDGLKDKIKKENDSLKKKLKEVKSFKEKYIRILADFQNYRKRIEKNFNERLKFESENILMGFLPIMDNLEYAENTAKVENVKNNNKFDSVLFGIKMVIKHFYSVLATFNVSGLNVLPGDKFDYSIHEAIGRIDYKEEINKNFIISEIIQKGYKFNNKLIRPSKVIVVEEKK